MNMEWYSFEESYLQSVDYNIKECKLVLDIDARMSINNPKIKTVKSLEESFEEIEIILEGVNYFKSINSKNLQKVKEDMGNIHSIALKESDEVGLENVGMIQNDNLTKIELNFQNGQKAEVYSKASNVKFLDFVSEMLAFRVGFERLSLIEK